MLISLLFKGHWYNVKVRGGIHAELTLRDDLLDRPVSFVFRVEEQTDVHFEICGVIFSVDLWFMYGYPLAFTWLYLQSTV